jgi:hypothetical protein
MPYTIRLDGSITTDSADEALELQRRIYERQQQTQPAITPLRIKNASIRINGHDLSDPVFERLRQFDGQELDAEAMREVLGLEKVDGVGSKLYYMKRRGVPLDDVLRERLDDNNNKVWRVRFPA